MAIRALLVVLPLAFTGVVVLNSNAFTSTACLASMWILLADFKKPAVHSYVFTGAGVILASVIGSLPLQAWPTVAVVILVTAWLGLWRGFGGFAASAGVVMTSSLLVSVGLRAAGQDPAMVIIGAICGAAAAGVVGILFASKERRFLRVQQTVTDQLIAVLDGRRPDSEAGHVSEELITGYIESKERPQAPTRQSAAMMFRLSALGRVGDLLSNGAGAEEPQLRRACARRLAGGAEPVVYDGDDMWTRALVDAVEIAADPPLVSRGEWRRQLRARLRPDSMLFTQTIFVSVLYGSLTAFVLFIHPDRPQWVLLGAVSASYPYARQAAFAVGTMLAATVTAFVVLMIIAVLANIVYYVWWALLIAAIALAAGATSSRIGKFIGQTSFTVVSLCLLALSLGGLTGQDAEIRFEDVAEGGLAALVIAAALAPRHLRLRFETALSGMYKAAANGVLDPVPGLDVCRAQFLRCTDAMESIRGTDFITTKHLVAWLDAARNIVQLVVASRLAQESGVDAQRQNEAASQECLRRAGELDENANITVYYPPRAHSRGEAQVRMAYDTLFEAQRRDLSDLTPLLPREYFNAES